MATAKRTRRDAEEAAIAAEEAGYRDEADSYGQGQPTDRLQFGYSPAVAAEAVAFHSLTSSQRWRTERAANYRLTILKLQKLPTKNFEPVESFFKLRKHWMLVSRGGRGRSTGEGSALGGEEAEDFLKLLAMQNLGVGAAVPPVSEEGEAKRKQHRTE
jgi:hypothetical protein